MTPLETTLWAATAAPAPQTAPLRDDTHVDVVVVGAGYAGLSTALHLAESGISVQVIEAGALGQGASGRSGGQVIPGIKYDPDDMLRLLGPRAGRQAIVNFGGTADKVFDLIARHGIDCDATRAGWVQPAHSPAGLQTALARCGQWQDAGADVAALSRAEVADLLGTDRYLGGWIDRRAGSVQPLSYTRGLARAALAQGARVATHSRVASLARDGARWCVTLDNGARVTAGHVVLCTNAYSQGLWPGLARSYIAVNSFQVATEPLDDAAAGHVLRGGVVASDTRRLLAYFRRDREGRVIIGGRGTFGDPNGPRDFAHIRRMLDRTFPELSDQPTQYAWSGRLTITRDHLPHLHAPEPGLLMLVGCQGRGVALQSRMGEWIADHIRTGRPDALPLPITPVRAIPFPELRRLYVAATLAWYKLRDALG